MTVAGRLLIGFALICMGLLLSGCPGSPMAANTWEKWEREKKDAELKRKYNASPPEQLSVWYKNTSGKVGHHMVASAVSTWTCTGSWWGENWSVVSGTLPPGLAFRSSGTSSIAGTPQAPGKWPVRIRVSGFGCTSKSGQKRTYPGRDLSVTFHIKGIAARRIE